MAPTPLRGRPRSTSRSAAAPIPRPHAPVDAQRRQTPRAPVVRERVEERVGRGVVAPGPASRAARPPTRTARRSRAACPRVSVVQVPGCPPPSGPSRREAVPSLLRSTPSSSTPAAVHDAAQRRQRRCDLLRARAPRRRSCATSPARRRTCAPPRAQVADGRARRVRGPARGPPATRCRAPRVHEPARRRAGQAPEATGDEVAGVPRHERCPRSRPDRPCTSTTLPTCRACAMERNASTTLATGNTRSGSGFSARRVATRASRRRSMLGSAGGSSPPSRVQVDRRSTTSRRSLPPTLLRGSRCPRLPISRKRPPGARTRQAARDGVARSELSTTSTPRPPVRPADLVGEGRERESITCGHAQGPQVLPASRGSGGGEDLGPDAAGRPGRRPYPPARRRVDQHALAVAQAGEMLSGY